MKDGQKYKAAVSQYTGNRETTALLIISKRVQEFTSFTTLASIYAKGKMFSALVNAICLYRAATRLSLSLVVNAGSGLQAELNGETRSYINVSENGKVDVVELVSIIYFVFSSCASLHRIESAEAYTQHV